jgi:hypothetical protein
MEVDWQRLESEVRRVHARYQVEVVEGLVLCPWAKQARRDGHVRLGISWMETPDTARAAAAVAEVMAAEIEVGMLAFPVLNLERLPFAHFAAAVRVEVEARYPRGQCPFALADFHPNAKADLATPERLVPFLRRAPDPLLQIVRQSVLESVRSEPQGTAFIDPSTCDLSALLAQAPETLPLSARVARTNARSVERLGVEHVSSLIADILADRDASYAALGLTLPTWCDKAPQPSNKLENPETK